jgi:hypothetical protein
MFGISTYRGIMLMIVFEGRVSLYSKYPNSRGCFADDGVNDKRTREIKQ